MAKTSEKKVALALMLTSTKVKNWTMGNHSVDPTVLYLTSTKLNIYAILR